MRALRAVAASPMELQAAAKAVGPAPVQPILPLPPDTEISMLQSLAAGLGHEEKERALRAFLERAPESGLAWKELSTALRMQGKDTLPALFKAAALLPEDAEVHSNMGTALRELGRLEEAEASCRRALRIAPRFVNAYLHLGNALFDMGRLDEAAASFRQGLSIEPANPRLHLNLSGVLLKAGHYPEGWREYEYRWQTPENKPLRDFTQPLWLGDRDLRGKAILLHTEQGFGDALQFVRYAALFAGSGATVYVLAPPSLKSLLASCTGVDVVFATYDLLPSFDFHCPLMSLPLAFQTTLDTIPATIPYLAASADNIGKWAQRMGVRRGLRVGLAWAGNPRQHFYQANAIDRQRSMTFDQLLPLLDVHGVEFFSLQLDGDVDRQSHEKSALIDITSGIVDFDDTAALISNLDLVISVDTAIVHLAGALGKPVWMLDRFTHCWRWLPQRTDSPWYPGMRIFRQSRLGEWSAAVADVRRALAERVQGS